MSRHFSGTGGILSQAFSARGPTAHPIGHAHGLILLTLTGDHISTITGCNDNSVLAAFALPRTLPK